MNIFMILLIIIGGGAGLLSTLYLIFSLIAVIGFKIFRKFKYGLTLFQ